MDFVTRRLGLRLPHFDEGGGLATLTPIPSTPTQQK
jgi:hypothetical protein